MDANKDQLTTLQEFLTLCEKDRIRIWLMGGWGLDFLLSKETRIHSDIDLILAREDYSSISRIVMQYGDIINMNTREKIKFLKNGTGFDICFFSTIDQHYYLDLDEKDPLVYPMPVNSFPMDEVSLLSGIKAHTISWEAQYVAKQGYFYYSDQPLREKDKQDLDIIEENLSESLEKLDTLLPGIEKVSLGLSLS